MPGQDQEAAGLTPNCEPREEPRRGRERAADDPNLVEAPGGKELLERFPPSRPRRRAPALCSTRWGRLHALGVDHGERGRGRVQRPGRVHGVLRLRVDLDRARSRASSAISIAWSCFGTTDDADRTGRILPFSAYDSVHPETSGPSSRGTKPKAGARSSPSRTTATRATGPLFPLTDSRGAR